MSMLTHYLIVSYFRDFSDNAYDPDVNATQLKIDIVDEEGLKCLTFLDNGAGMSPHTLYKMLSFGFCDKVRLLANKSGCQDYHESVDVTFLTLKFQDLLA